jgi:hypothetical protein
MPNKKNLHIVDSYKVWSIKRMDYLIHLSATATYNIFDVEEFLNRTMRSMYIEWWLHNIGYYLTKPLCHIPFFKALNKRFKDVDLEEWK